MLLAGGSRFSKGRHTRQQIRAACAISPEQVEARVLLSSAPVAVDDLVQTQTDEAVSFDPTANDSDAEGDRLSVVSVEAVSQGTVSQNGNSLTFTPDAGFAGQDTLLYSVSDGTGNQTTGSIVVTVSPPATSPAARPFGQHVDYGAGILPDHVNRAQLDDDVRSFYDDWKRDYLVSAGSVNGRSLYRVAFSQGSSETVSEGQGYGMIIVAAMAGHDPAAQELFDGLWAFSRANPSSIDSRLMDWHTPVHDGDDSAFDGDADIAFGLLLADAQWGSSGNVNYAADAATVIAGIYESTIGPDTQLPELGDWVSASGSPFNQSTPRPSDFMPSHFRSYGRATGDARWDAVVSATQSVVESLQTNHAPATGLLPDFVVDADTSPQPSPGTFLEGPYDDAHSYNSARVPWRIGLDGLLNGDATSISQAQRISTWAESSTGGNPQNFHSGYRLNGTPLPGRGYMSTAFVAPLGVAAMNNPNQQAWLNSIYDTVVGSRQGYFEDSIAMISLIAMTGNYWDPTDGHVDTDPPDEVITVVADAAAHVRGGRFSNRNYGRARQLVLRNYAQERRDFESFVRFDLSNLEGQVESAVLSLVPKRIGIGMLTTDLRIRLVADADDDWVEGNGGTNNNPLNEVTWDNHPSGTGAELTVSGAGLHVDSPFEIDVTSLLDQELHENGVVSLHVDVPAQRNSNTVSFYSDEYSTESFRPVLSVTLASEPPPATPPVLDINDVSVTEGDSGNTAATFTLTLSKASDVTIAGQGVPRAATATADADYQSAAVPFSFAPGETSITLTVNVIGDTAAEDSESFFVDLAGVNDAWAGDVIGEVTIVDDDAVAPGFAYRTTSDWGSGFNGEITLTNNGAQAWSGWTVEFDWEHDITSIWNAEIVSHEGEHYVIRNASWNGSVSAGGSVSFGFGGSPGNVSPTPRNVVINGTSPGGGDPPPPPPPPVVPTISVDDATVTEGDSGVTAATFTVSLSEAAAETVTAQFTTRDDSATAGSDYTATAGTVAFDLGEVTKTFTVDVLGDTVDEASESFFVDLLGIVGALEGDLTGTGTITDDDDPTPPPPPPNPGSGKRIVGYFPSWGIYGRDYQVEDIPAGQLTHVNYAFANIGADLRIAQGDAYADSINFPALQTLKQQSPDLQTMISVGGWTWSERFSDVALSAASRATFATSAVNFMVQYGFDGIDIDWEYPVSGGQSDNVNRPEDKHNYTLLMQELRTQLDVLEAQNSRDYWLSIAAAAGPYTMGNYELAALAGTLDWINLMAYDLAGYWDPVTGHNAALYDQAANPMDDRLNWDSAVNAYLAAGVPADKLVVGAPFYGRVFGGVGSTSNGLYQADSINISGTSGETGYLAYWDIQQKYLPAANGYTRYWDAEAQVPYLYNPATQQFVTYDDEQSIGLKADYINDRDLGGLMFWELATDAHDHSLLSTVHERLGQPPGPPAPPSVSVSDASIVEGDSGTTTLTFTATLSRAPASGESFSVDYSTADGTAWAGTDYEAAAGTLTFAAGEKTKQVAVAVFGEALEEANETLLLNLSGAAGGTIADAQAIGTIEDDDTPIAATVSFRVTSDWGSGHVVEMKITNQTNAPLTDWRLEFDYASEITGIWSALIESHSGSRYVLKPASWTSTIAVGGTITFGFQADGPGSSPTNAMLNGHAVAVT